MNAIIILVFAINVICGQSSGKIADTPNDDLEHKIQSVKSMADILKLFKLPDGVEVASTDEGKHTKYTFTEEGVGRHGHHRIEINVAKQAHCKPRRIVKETRHLTATDGHVIWPTCISYKQCGGCCTDKTRECTPVRYEEKNVHLMVVSNEDNKIKFQPYTYHEHKKCSCTTCKIKEHHCVGKEEYSLDECRCICNVKEKCEALKQWSRTDCKCVCKNLHNVECNPYEEFNKDKCKCEFKTWLEDTK